MAITKILAQSARLDVGIKYILNGGKIEEQILTAHLNCDSGRECRQMLDTKRVCGKMDGAQYYHVIRSFKPGEITPELALKKLLALTMALAKNNQTISGKVNMTKMLRETRDLQVFPITPEQYKQFQKHAKRQKILFSAIKDRDGKGKLIDVVLPVTELNRVNVIFERMMYQGPVRQAPKQEEKPAPSLEKGS